MTFDIGLHDVCVRVGVRYVITKFSRMDRLPNFVTHGAPLRALRARELRYNMLIKVITNTLQKVLCSVTTIQNRFTKSVALAKILE